MDLFLSPLYVGEVGVYRDDMKGTWLLSQGRYRGRILLKKQANK